jgi:DNA-binding transcriptional MocR family regulator
MRTLRGTVVAVDETFADLVLDGEAPRPAACFDAGAMTIGSMSKAFWAGLRIGWIRAAPDLITRLAHARAAQDLASPVLEQLVATELLGVAHTVLPERRELLRRSRAGLVSALADELPDWRCAMPAAGMFAWVQLPGLSATRLAAHALDLGLRLTPGPRFTIRGTGDQYLRLPFTLPAEQAPGVVRLLREAAERVQAGRPTARSPSRWTA